MGRFFSVFSKFAAGSLLIVLAYVVLWQVEAARARTEIARFIAARAAHGMAIHSGTVEIGGFPFRLEADFGTLTVDGLPFAKTAHLEAPMLVGRARPWRPSSWRFEAARGFTLDLGLGGKLALSVAAGDARGRADADSGDPGGLDIAIDCHDLALKIGSSGATASHGSLQLIVPDKPPEDHTTPSLTFSAVVDRAVLPSDLEVQDGPLDRVSIAGVVEGPVPEQPLMPALAAWREGGGSVELRQVAIHWGAVDLAGDGTLTLDTNLQPEAAFSGRIRGWDILLEDFVQAGTLTAAQANYYRLGLGLLTRIAADGKSELRAPITLQNAQIYLGPAKIAKLPPISWQ